MEAIGPGLHHGIDNSQSKTEFRRKRVLLNFEFLDGVDGREQISRSDKVILSRDAVEDIIPVLRSSAIDDEGPGGAHFLIDLASPANLRLGHAWDELCQVQIISPIEGEADDGLVLDHLSLWRKFPSAARERWIALPRAP